MASEAYVEAIATLADPRQGERVQEWLKGHGLRVVPMVAGLLIQGDRATFDTAFGTDLSQTTLPAVIPIPDELEGLLTSITVPALRRYYQSP